MRKLFILLIILFSLTFFDCTNDDCNCKEADTYNGLVYSDVLPEYENMLTQEQREAMTRKCRADGC